MLSPPNGRVHVDGEAFPRARPAETATCANSSIDDDDQWNRLEEVVRRLLLDRRRGSAKLHSMEAGAAQLAFVSRRSDGDVSQAVLLIVVSGSQVGSEMYHNLQRMHGLTKREAEVAILLTQYRTNKEIARLLNVTSYTARRHTEKVLAKLGVATRRDVPRLLEELGGIAGLLNGIGALLAAQFDQSGGQM